MNKAASDHLVRAWSRTYGLPVVVTNCSNNYGPYHFPEKLIPLTILNGLAGKPLPVYGDGQQIRDWLYVEDHARALYLVATTGKTGETWNIGGHNERTNLDVVETVCALLEELVPEKPAGVCHYRDLITFVADRPGHDVRYAIDAGKIARELGWLPQETFDSGMRKTVAWYLSNKVWWQQVPFCPLQPISPHSCLIHILLHPIFPSYKRPVPSIHTLNTTQIHLLNKVLITHPLNMAKLSQGTPFHPFHHTTSHTTSTSSHATSLIYTLIAQPIPSTHSTRSSQVTHLYSTHPQLLRPIPCPILRPMC